MKKIVLLLCLFMLCVSALAVTPDEYDTNAPQLLEAGHLYGEAALVIDADTGEVLFTNNSRVRMYPASTTKMMTLLIGIEEGPAPDTVVTVPREASQIDEGSSVIPVKPGDQTYFGDLLYGFLLTSGNDGANAIAVLTSGSIDAFVSRMNERAAQLGCEGTHFVNAHGLQNENHYTTAQDLARIAREGLNNPLFAEISRTQKYTMRILRGGEKKYYEVTNRNEMLLEDNQYYYADCTGIKTGHTGKAGYCFVGSAERDGVRLIAVTMNCPKDEQKWYDTARLLEYGFTRYSTLNVETLYQSARGNIGRVTIENAKDDGALTLSLANISDSAAGIRVITGSDTSRTRALQDFQSGCQVEYVRELTAPVQQGETLARLTYTGKDGQTVTADLIADRDVAAKPKPKIKATPVPTSEHESGRTAEASPVRNIVLIAIGVIALIIALLIIKAIRDEQRRRRRRRRKRKKKKH